MLRCKAPETGDPPEGWGLCVLRRQIPRDEAYYRYKAHGTGLTAIEA